jgi:prepilin-type N-terminal cleavage/methylation domain-containing protein
MTRNFNFTRAFTLIELLVVIAIVAILASITYPVYTGVLERAKVTKDMNNLRQIGLATQTYMNDNDGVIFSSAAGVGNWMAQLNPKYLSAWGVFQSPFDTRSPSELGTVATPVSYGINGVVPSIIGMAADKISKPSVFILFAPAQASTATVTFQGTAVTTAPGVTVFKTVSVPPGAAAIGGTHSSRKRINALFADLHSENMVWSVFINDTNSSSDPSAAQRWTP